MNVSHSLPKGIWALGFVSLFMDMSSELVHSLLPVFMTTVLGASMITIGLIEGVAEAAAAAAKVFSGAISDRIRQRKALVVIGYGLSALTKPMFPLATSIGGWGVASHRTHRIGHPIRATRRDGRGPDTVPPPRRGIRPGPRPALDRSGAWAPPRPPLLGMVCQSHHVKAVRGVAVVPALPVVVVVAAVASTPPP